ncbi:MAG: energy-coupling factor transporter ATPase [Lachnospiraceae bacterium]|nr:energy-coupling factor transporter ATPase [Lachnospiraceae bacterium]
MDIIKILNLIHEYKEYDDDEQETGTVRALSDVSVDIPEGQFVAVLGHNGSGKSTLAKHVNALLLPTEGIVYVGDKDTRIEDNVLAIRQSAGMIFQNPDNQIIGNTIEEDVAFGPENMGVPTEEIVKRIDFALEKVGMAAYRLRSPNQLSGGQKQRVGIAGLLSMRPQCILMDEPTAMLDPVGRREVLETVHELNRREKMTVILITHYMEEAVDADRVLVMDGGKLVMDGTPREIFAQAEKLKEYHLTLPQVTELAWELKKEGIDLPDAVLTNEEFVEAICRLN